MTESLEKIAYIVKEKSKWCVKSEKGKNMGCYKSKAEAKKRLQQIEFFKHKKGELLERMADIGDRIDRQSEMYLGDVVNECIAAVSDDNFDIVSIRLMKLGNRLDQDGLFNLAEDVDALIPDILELKNDRC